MEKKTRTEREGKLMWKKGKKAERQCKEVSDHHDPMGTVPRESITCAAKSGEESGR